MTSPRRPPPPPARIPLADRLQFGLVAACFGAVLGALAALLVLALAAATGLPLAGTWGMVGYSVAFLFVVGVVRGAEAGDTAADGLGALAGLLLGALGTAAGGAPTADGRPAARGAWWWGVAWLAGLGLLAWQG